ncbi:MAG: hypothetical protein Q9191_005917 [Dirinaria sp. TL-2023a]
MADVTALDYFTWKVRENTQQKQLALARAKPTPEQFWKAAYEFDPLGSSTGTVTELQEILSTRHLESVPLGKLYGLNEAKLELIPGMGALPTTEATDLPDLHYAATDSGAISYPDGHPSEFDEPRLIVTSLADNKLRRSASLGWVIHVRPDGSWRKTGHVLVMDMDAGRDRHPWFVLASEWPSDFEDVDGGFTTYAERKVFRDDATQPGVLPSGGKNRTPVAKVYVNQEKDTSELPMLKRFGPDFEFELIRLGGTRSYDENDRKYGPDLAHVMEWYWDPATEEEVCFDKRGKEYMRYDRRTKQYTYPEWDHLHRSVVGESALFGTLTPPSSDSSFGPLSARLISGPEPSTQQRRQRETSTAANF